MSTGKSRLLPGRRRCSVRFSARHGQHSIQQSRIHITLHRTFSFIWVRPPRRSDPAVGRRPHANENTRNRAVSGILDGLGNESALAELRRATGSLEAVLREFSSRFSLIFRAFPALCLSVILYGNHKKQRFFIEPGPDEKHR